MFKTRSRLTSILGIVALALGIPGVALAYSFTGFPIPGGGGYNCTVARTATQAPNFTVYLASATTLNFASGESCTQTASGGIGGTKLSGWVGISGGQTKTWNVGDINGQSIQLWIGTPPWYIGTTYATGTWTP